MKQQTAAAVNFPERNVERTMTIGTLVRVQSTSLRAGTHTAAERRITSPNKPYAWGEKIVRIQN